MLFTWPLIERNPTSSIKGWERKGKSLLGSTDSFGHGTRERVAKSTENYVKFCGMVDKTLRQYLLLCCGMVEAGGDKCCGMVKAVGQWKLELTTAGGRNPRLQC